MDPRFGTVEELCKQNDKGLGNYVVMVWQGDKVVYQHQASTDFSLHSQAPIGRSGDLMVAALVMTFVDEGKLSLDDKVTKFIPLFGTYMKGYITIRNCLTNTTGIRTDPAGVMKVLQKSKDESLEDEVNSYASKRDIVSNPGTEIFYSNIGINIVGRVLEIVGKKGFDRLMMERIQRPLKMRSTSFSNDEGGATNPAGGGKSSAADYINFLSMLLNKGMFADKKVLSEKAVEELAKIQFGNLPVKFVPKAAQAAHYCLGAFVMDSNGSGAGSVLTSPNFLGTMAWLDRSRNYGAILITEKAEEEKKPALLLNLKTQVDQALGGGN
jgi:CubicO group peptidase (beta-lactamase class C family)